MRKNPGTFALFHYWSSYILIGLLIAGRVAFSFYNTIFVFPVKVAKGNDKLPVV
jgi:hypothetical protein